MTLRGAPAQGDNMFTANDLDNRPEARMIGQIAEAMDVHPDVVADALIFNKKALERVTGLYASGAKMSWQVIDAAIADAEAEELEGEARQ